LYPADDPDWVQLIHDDDMWAARVEAWGSFFHVDFECVWHPFGGERHYAGLDGLRAFMRDWTAPWVIYRVRVEEAIDLGDRVLVLNNDRGRREESAQDVRGRLATLWTMRDGRVSRLDTYETRAEGLRAAGLPE
jgi:ketosteroid isomerase-like protein